MSETKPNEPNTIPEPDDPKEEPSQAGIDPSQTVLMPAKAVVDKHILNSPAIGSAAAGGLAAESEPDKGTMGWFNKLPPAAKIWVSLSIVLIFLIALFLLITPARQKQKAFKSSADDQQQELAEKDDRNALGILKSKLARQAPMTTILLLDKEFAGQAPIAVKASGPVFSATIDPELAAIADALKIRLQLLAESKTTIRGKISTRATKGEFRGFKISVEEKIDNQNIISEEIIVTTPKKGFFKTVNHVLETVKDSDLERFTSELQSAGLEINRLPPVPENSIVQVQIKTVNAWGTPVASDYLISGKSVGKISLGMPTAQLETMLLSSYIVLKRKVLVNDIYYDVYKILDQNNEPLFFIYENKGRVWGISIISEIFKTENGFGIGSSLGNIRINGSPVKVGISEKNTPFVEIDGVDGLFIIQSEGVDFSRQIFPNQTKIISILIGNSPEFE